jgi:hypothetical protein
MSEQDGLYDVLLGRKSLALRPHPLEDCLQLIVLPVTRDDDIVTLGTLHHEAVKFAILVAKAEPEALDGAAGDVELCLVRVHEGVLALDALVETFDLRDRVIDG